MQRSSSKLLPAALLIWFVAALAGCTTPYSEPVFDARPPGQTDFAGLARLVETSPDKTLDVVLVHGMCTHTEKWAKGAISQLNDILGDQPAPTLSKEDVSDSQAVIYRSRLAVAGGTVRATAILWAPILAPLKSQLCYDQTNKSEVCVAAGQDQPAYPYQRATVNRMLKDSLLDDCLADAIIYQGQAKNSIIDQMQLALLAAVAPGVSAANKLAVQRAAAAQQSNLVLITSSLGSKIAFDALSKMIQQGDEDAKAAGMRTLDRVAQIFMHANQLPILALADQDLAGKSAFGAEKSRAPADSLDELLNLKGPRFSAKSGKPCPLVVAFNDPSDLLSYVLAPARRPGNYAVVDVLVSNAPTYLGWLERPDRAHIGYPDNKQVQALMVQGHSNPGSDPCGL